MTLMYGRYEASIEQISSGGTVTYLHHDQQGSTRVFDRLDRHRHREMHLQRLRQRLEIEFFPDGEIEIERFVSTGVEAADKEVLDALLKVLRRRPILVLESDKLGDVRRHKTVRWDSVVDARLDESKGLMGRVYHELVVNGAHGDHITLSSIDMLSLPWTEIATLVEEHLPETVPLQREILPPKKKRRS
jgi:hypothetical protein